MGSAIYANGRTLESDFLGKAIVLSEDKITYSPKGRSLIQAVFSQKHNLNRYTKEETLNPPTILMRKIKNHMQEIMGKDVEIRVFDTVSTSLDRHYGVDMIVNFLNKKTGEEVAINVDITENFNDKNVNHDTTDLFLSDEKALINFRYHFDNQEVIFSSDGEERNSEIAKLLTEIAKRKMQNNGQKGGIMRNLHEAFSNEQKGIRSKEMQNEMQASSDRVMLTMFEKSDLEKMKLKLLLQTRRHFFRVLSATS